MCRESRLRWCSSMAMNKIVSERRKFCFVLLVSLLFSELLGDFYNELTHFHKYYHNRNQVRIHPQISLTQPLPGAPQAPNKPSRPLCSGRAGPTSRALPYCSQQQLSAFSFQTLSIGLILSHPPTQAIWY